MHVQEMLHYSNKANLPLGIFKVVMHKAFDISDWRFLLKVLLRLG